MRRPRRSILAACLAAASGLLATAAAAPSASAQDAGAGAAAGDEPIVVGRRQRYRWLEYERPEVLLEVLAQYTNDTFKTSGEGSGTEASNLLFRESISARTRGHVLSPKIFEFHAYGRLGLDQVRAESNGESGSDDGTFQEWDLTGTLLKEGNAPLTAYARRSVSLINRPFAPSVETTTTNYGAELRLVSDRLPTTFRLYRQELTQESVSGSSFEEQFGALQDFTSTQDTFEWHTDWRLGEGQTLTWDYVFNRVDERSDAGPGFDPDETAFDTHEATLQHLWTFGATDLRSDLRSTLMYYNQGGDFDQERIRLDETLTLRHSRTFETRYNYRFNDFSVGDSQQTTHRLSAGFVHRLFQSLTTSGQVGAGRIDYGGDADATTDEYFANLQSDYTKAVPLGRLSLAASANYNLQRNDARAEPFRVINEAHTAPLALPIVVRQRNADGGPDSVLVTNLAGVPYRRGLDYTVDAFPDRLEIRRTFGGLIAPDSTVLVSYDVVPEPASDITTMSFGFGGRYDIAEGPFKGLSLYARYIHQDQEIDSANEDLFTPDDVDDYTLGVEYRVWKLILTAEHQVHDSTIAPYDQTRLDAQFIHRPSSDFLLTLSASQTMISYEEGTDTDLLVLSGSVHRRFSRQLIGRATATWLREDSTDGWTEGFEQELELNWKHRQTEIFGLLRHSELEDEADSNEFFLFQLGVRRYF